MAIHRLLKYRGFRPEQIERISEGLRRDVAGTWYS